MDSRSPKRFGPFLFDAQERVLQREGQPVALTPKAFDLLAAFVDQPGRLLSKDDLLKRVWPETFVEESNLAYHVFILRRALGDGNGRERYIETVPKRGYRFTASVTPAVPEPDEPAAAGQTSDTPGEHQAGPAFPPPLNARRRPAPSLASRLGIFGVVALPAIALYLIAWTRQAPREPEPMRAVPLTSIRGAVRGPTLSPDGRFMVFSWAGEDQSNPDLYVQQIGAGDARRLTSDEGNDFSPSWSPDGQTIAFLRRAPGSRLNEVWLIPPLGGPEHRLAELRPGLGSFFPPTLGWCADSRCLVTVDSQGPTAPDAIFAIAIDTGEKRQLTHPTPQSADGDPVVSPDGRAMVFLRRTTPYSGQFYRLPVARGLVPDGEPVRLSSPIMGFRPTWTADSREIVFSWRQGLWRLAVNGGTPTRIPFIGQDGHSPVLAATADGRQRLVYGRSFGEANVLRLNFAVAGAPSDAAPVLAVASTRGDFLPSLSPDGGRVAFLSDRSGELHIWAADVDGAQAIQLTSAGFASAPGYPRWSPNGETVAFHGDPAARPDVAVVPAGGGTMRVLTAAQANGAYPSFSRDGRWLYFCSIDSSKEARIWKMPSAGGPATQVTDNSGTIAVESYDGRDLYYVEATHRPSALWRVPTAGGPAVKVLDGVLFGNFDVTEDGIYFIERAGGESGGFLSDRPGATRLRYFDFAHQSIVTASENLGWAGRGLTASRDGRTVYYARIDSSTDELMVVDDFR